MTTSLLEAIGVRRRVAAENAADAAAILDQGGSRSLTSQADLEQALVDLERYANQYDRVERIAAEMGEYRRGGRSIIRDLWSSRSGDRAASKRLASHARASNAGALHEQRDIGNGSVWSSIPRALLDDAAPLSTNVAPTVRLLAKPMPVGAQGTIQVVGFSSPPTATAQNGFNGSLSTPSIVDIGPSPAVSTFAVRARLSIQLLEQGSVGVDEFLLPAMTAACDAKIGDSLLNGGGTSGELLGVRHMSGIGSQTYTDTTPTLVEAWPVIESAVRSVSVGMPGGILVVSPRRWSWIRQQAVVENLSAFEFAPPTLPGAHASVFGATLNVVVDPGLPTNLGAGTNEDVCVAMRSVDAVDLWVGDARVQLGDIDGSTVYVNVWKQAALTSRLPAGLAVVGGSGFTMPTP